MIEGGGQWVFQCVEEEVLIECPVVDDLCLPREEIMMIWALAEDLHHLHQVVGGEVAAELVIFLFLLHHLLVAGELFYKYIIQKLTYICVTFIFSVIFLCFHVGSDYAKLCVY